MPLWPRTRKVDFPVGIGVARRTGRQLNRRRQVTVAADGHPVGVDRSREEAGMAWEMVIEVEFLEIQHHIGLAGQMDHQPSRSNHRCHPSTASRHNWPRLVGVVVVAAPDSIRPAPWKPRPSSWTKPAPRSQIEKRKGGSGASSSGRPTWPRPATRCRSRSAAERNSTVSHLPPPHRRARPFQDPAAFAGGEDQRFLDPRSPCRRCGPVVATKTMAAAAFVNPMRSTVTRHERGFPAVRGAPPRNMALLIVARQGHHRGSTQWRQPDRSARCPSAGKRSSAVRQRRNVVGHVRQAASVIALPLWRHTSVRRSGRSGLITAWS